MESVTLVSTFMQSQDDAPTKRGWMVISMKNDWKRLFLFEKYFLPLQAREPQPW